MEEHQPPQDSEHDSVPAAEELDDELQDSGVAGAADDEQEQPEPDSESLPSPAELDPRDQRSLLTAVLFSAGETVELARLTEFLACSEKELELMANEAGGELRPLGLDILKVAGGYKLLTSAMHDEYLRLFNRKVRRARLTRNALEVLAIIAYEQPVTRAKIEELRQVPSESTVRTLLDRRLITVAGREESPGRPFLYRTTDAFLEMFGLAGLIDLPPRPAALEKGTDSDAAGDIGSSLGLSSMPELTEEELDRLDEDELAALDEWDDEAEAEPEGESV
ncbi:MAG: SMC-Scp complex subunit ScpB [Planctomycetales bacterium]|nr:SMC-Scp complex subunit ScpB [bacterium]UNM09050.1 MAG: SMC-Scp complex subunit ScpB [Planctomycetales bacterium]